MPGIFSGKISHVFVLRHVGYYKQLKVKLSDQYLYRFIHELHQIILISLKISSMKGQFIIYDGLFTKQVNLAAVKPEKIIQSEDVYLEIHNDARVNALKYRHPLDYLGSQYKGIVVPCTPAYEISVRKLNTLDQNQNQESRDLKFFAKVPSFTAEVQDFGIASGKRSSIYRQPNGKLLRFKGCGNEQKGFNRENDQSRGHHFYHTAKRELYITNQINKIMQQKLGINPPANRPLYAFDYPDKQINQLKLANDLPMISKYCCVFETQGDRRAGTHLISPLQILFLTLVDHKNVAWKPKFQQKSRIQSNGELIELVTNFELFVPPGQKFLPTYDSSNQINNYLAIEEVKINLVANYSEVLTDITAKLVPEAHRQYVLGLLTKIKAQNFVELTQIIIEKIGFEMGQIKRAMCEHEISWGFYLDHGFEWHCNAHLNNFIVTQPKSQKQSSNFFLLPLDYDLAYSSKEFICIDKDSDSYGKNSDEIFQNYLCGQFSAMEMSLFGLQVMNFKYGIDKEETLSVDKKMSKIVFRDTLVKAFNAGMRSKNSLKEKISLNWDKNIQEIKSLVEACLYLSMDFQT